MRSLALASLALLGVARADDGVMTLQLLSDPLAVCNDGSPAGYYFRPGVNASQFVIHLMGGWYCFDEQTCAARAVATPFLMSTKPWAPTFSQGGITSNNATVNPQWWAASAVEVIYCSSDMHSGNASISESGLPWHFRGAHIVQAVLADLVARHGLGAAKQVVFAGSSAGGTGTQTNADAVAAALPWADVRFLADSGWFLPHAPFGTPNCSAVDTCPGTVGIALGIPHWKPSQPAACLAARNASAAYECFFGPLLFSYIESKVFVAQYLFDMAQESFDVSLPPWTPTALAYNEQTAAAVVATLAAPHGVFAPSCFQHQMVIFDEWTTITVAGRSLPQVFAEWWGTGSAYYVDGACLAPNSNPTCYVV